MRYRVTHLWTILEQRERSVSWLARKCGYTPQYFWMIRGGARPWTDEIVRRVSVALDLPLETLFERINDTEATAAD